MHAMILAAGLGTRLRPLTETLPKALVEVAGVPMLERVARRLIDAGATRIVVNVHHHADQIRSFVERHHGFGVEILLSLEAESPLETGGGLLKAAALLDGNEPFLLHNVDVVSDCDLHKLWLDHTTDDRLATLAVNDRESSRYLLFDASGLVGYGNTATGFERLARTPGDMAYRKAFCGIHVVSPRIFPRIQEQGAFSIIPLYMRLTGEGERIVDRSIEPALWVDIGSPQQLAHASNILSIA